ncbi:MAG: phosphate acyltransferase PlsX, partial [Clostridia bacterium]|nr:phosphate acyltransferase PlsX [Clostridia bacterium]
MRIIVDVMSGDNAPLETIKGAICAAEAYEDKTIVIVGDENVISDTAVKNALKLPENIEILSAKSVVTMEDKPMAVLREKKDSSMGVGLRALANGDGDAFVSAGNTGALITGATLIVKRIMGINRAAIASVLPLANPVLLMDSGANLTVTSDNMLQFAFMGAKYMEKIYDIDRPRVGQLNNGTEYNKGNALQVESYQALSESGLNFVGNVESKEVPFGVCDVLVADGFTGNIFLKSVEGMGKFMLGILKDVLYTNIATQVSALTMKNKLKDIKHRFDSSEHGGAPILGISKPVIKAHGSSDANAIKNAVRQAISFVESGINNDIIAFAADYDEKKILADAEKMIGTRI